MKQFKQLLLSAVLLYGILPAYAQAKLQAAANNHKVFNQLLKEAHLTFTLPPGFKEIKAVNNEYFSFDYGMGLPVGDFTVWLQVKSQMQNWASYIRAKEDGTTSLANPDSMYLAIGNATALALSGKRDYLVRNMPTEVLARYNADAGKSYLLNLLDMPVSNHYKYALIIALQKNHTGTLVAVFFTNEKDSDFYRNVYLAAHSFKFTQGS